MNANERNKVGLLEEIDERLPKEELFAVVERNHAKMKAVLAPRDPDFMQFKRLRRRLYELHGKMVPS